MYSSNYFSSNYDYQPPRGSSWAATPQVGPYTAAYRDWQKMPSSSGRQLSGSYMGTTSVLNRDVTPRHFYDFLEKPKSGQTGFSELASKMLEKDIHLNNLRPWNPNQSSYSAYTPMASASPIPSAKYQDVKFRLEMSRQKMDSRFPELETQTGTTRGYSVSQMRGCQVGGMRGSQQVESVAGRSPSERVVRLSVPAGVSTRWGVLQETTSPFSLKGFSAENQMNLRVSIVQNSTEGVRQEPRMTPNCSFQNIEERRFQSIQPFQAFQVTPQTQATSPVRVVRSQSTGIMALNRSQMPPQPQHEVKRSVTRIDSYTFTGQPVQVGTSVTPSQTNQWPPNISTHFLPHLLPKTPLPMSLPFFHQMEDDVTPNSPNTLLKSILKINRSLYKKKRVTVDENRNEVKEFEKMSPRRLSIVAPSDPRLIEMAITSPPTIQRPIPTQQRTSQPFQALNTSHFTNITLLSTTYSQSGDPKIRNHSRIMI